MSMIGVPPGLNFPDNYYMYNFNDYSGNLGSFYYSNLSEKRYAYQLNISVPFKLLNANQSFKAGYQGSHRKADFGADRYRLRRSPDFLESFDGLAYTDVYTNRNYADKKLYLIPIISGAQKYSMGSATGYDGAQNLNSVYGMLDVKPTGHLTLIGGLRMEQNDQKVYTNTIGKVDDASLPTPVVDSLIRLKKIDWLPSLNAIYALSDKMNLRAAYYETVARPDLKELSFFEYFDFDISRNISGGNLKSTQIKNFDLRYEFYPSPDEIISVSGFYKKFTNPIELSFANNSNGPVYLYKNLSSAKDLGFEIDFRKSLRFVSATSSFFKNLYLSGSFTLVDASVELSSGSAVDEQGNPVERKRNRPLFGQSPYIINGGINYNGSRLGVNVVYNKYGKRIVFATANTSQDEYEKPRDLIDLQISYKFFADKKAEIRFNISDLLNQQLITYRNEYGPGNPTYPERTPSVKPYPGDGTAAYPADQLDSKGTSYNPKYDVVTFRKKDGTNYTINFIYRF